MYEPLCLHGNAGVTCAAATAICAGHGGGEALRVFVAAVGTNNWTYDGYICAGQPVGTPPGAPIPGRPAINPATVIDRLVGQMVPPTATLGARPSDPAVAGLPTYFWLRGIAPKTRSWQDAAFVVTVRVAPASYAWNFGDGGVLTTTTPGRPWSRSLPGNVAHTYQRGGSVEVHVSVRWGVVATVNGRPFPVAGGALTTQASGGLQVQAMAAVLAP